MKQQTKKWHPELTSPSSSDPVTKFSFMAVTCLVFCVWFYLYTLWGNTLPVEETSSLTFFPRFTDFVQNMKLTFQGYTSGYLRTGWGYGVFLTMAVFFMATGKVILNCVFRVKEKTLINELGLLEKASLYYILGSLLGSLIWFGLGMAGTLNIVVASCVGISGFLLFYQQFFYRNPQLQPTFKASLNAWMNVFSLTEKVLVSLLFIILLLWSARSVPVQTYSDVFQIHLPLSYIYMHDGGILENQYFIYSYFPQNTEMLVLWALLLKSEVAAALLIWGFMISLVLLVWGYLKRTTTNFVALSTLFILISAPVISWFSTAIKNDLPTGLFLLAHYLAMAEALNKSDIQSEESKRWILLSGILCGGAIGHKLTALIPALITFLILFGRDLYLKYKKRGERLLRFTSYWLAGLLAAVFPWFLRTFILTGNPVYPYFNRIFGDVLVKPWHWHPTGQSPTAIVSGGSEMLLTYFKSLLGTNLHDGLIYAPNWGPPILFCFLGLVCFRRKFPVGFRLCLIASILSWILSLCYSHEIRYHIGFFTFVGCIPFALCFAATLTQNRHGKAYRMVTLITVLLCFFQTFTHSKMMVNIKESCAFLLSGFSPYNLDNAEVDEQMSDLNWMSHIINTRTQENETLLFAGVGYGYGVNRKIFYGVYPDKQIIHDVAENSSDAGVLKESLRKMGVDHILFSASIYDTNRVFEKEPLRIEYNEVLKIKKFLQNHMDLRFQTAKGTMLLYSFKDKVKPEPVLLNQGDLLKFPLHYIEYAKQAAIKGNLEQAEKMLELATHSPMLPANREIALTQLAEV